MFHGDWPKKFQYGRASVCTPPWPLTFEYVHQMAPSHRYWQWMARFGGLTSICSRASAMITNYHPSELMSADWRGRAGDLGWKAVVGSEIIISILHIDQSQLLGHVAHFIVSLLQLTESRCRYDGFSHSQKARHWLSVYCNFFPLPYWKSYRYRRG